MRASGFEPHNYCDGVRAVLRNGAVGTEPSPARQALMPLHLRLPQPFYLELMSTDWALPLIVFRAEAPDMLIRALDALRLITATPQQDAPDFDELPPWVQTTADYLAACIVANLGPAAVPAGWSGKDGSLLGYYDGAADKQVDVPSLKRWYDAFCAAATGGLLALGAEPWLPHFGYCEREHRA